MSISVPDMDCIQELHWLSKMYSFQLQMQLCLYMCVFTPHTYIRKHIQMPCINTHAHIHRYFGKREDFEEARRKRWQQQLTAYMATLAADVRDDVMRDMQQLIKDTRLQFWYIQIVYMCMYACMYVWPPQFREVCARHACIDVTCTRIFEKLYMHIWMYVCVWMYMCMCSSGFKKAAWSLYIYIYTYIYIHIFFDTEVFNVCVCKVVYTLITHATPKTHPAGWAAIFGMSHTKEGTMHVNVICAYLYVCAHIFPWTKVEVRIHGGKSKCEV